VREVKRSPSMKVLGETNSLKEGGGGKNKRMIGSYSKDRRSDFSWKAGSSEKKRVPE